MLNQQRYLKNYTKNLGEMYMSEKVGHLNNTIVFVFKNCHMIFEEYYVEIICFICTSRKILNRFSLSFRTSFSLQMTMDENFYFLLNFLLTYLNKSR